MINRNAYFVLVIGFCERFIIWIFGYIRRSYNSNQDFAVGKECVLEEAYCYGRGPRVFMPILFGLAYDKRTKWWYLKIEPIYDELNLARNISLLNLNKYEYEPHYYIKV